MTKPAKKKSLLRKPGKPRKKDPRFQEKVSPARLKAHEVLSAVRHRSAYAQELIATRIDASSLSREDRAFATKLVLGVVSRGASLDDVIDSVISSPNDLDEDVREALRIGAYELIFLDKPDHAVVYEGVELVRTFRPQAVGVANWVLRHIADTKAKFPYGDPLTDASAYARLHGFPLWLVERLRRDLGAQAAHEFMVASNDPAPLYVAANAVHASEREVFDMLVTAKGEPRLVEIGGERVLGCFEVNNGRVMADVGIKKAVGEGKLFVADASAQAIANLALPERKPASLLEIGAGRGGKTLLLQSDAYRRWLSQVERYIAVDDHEFKTAILRDRANVYGTHIDETLTGDATDLDAVVGDELFDVVFVDAPCSGLGTLRRHPEIRWRLQPEDIDELAGLGERLLASAARHVASGGRLVYATCTVTRQENEDVIGRFLDGSEGRGFRLVPQGEGDYFKTQLAPGSPDAHFCAVLEKAQLS